MDTGVRSGVEDKEQESGQVSEKSDTGAYEEGPTGPDPAQRSRRGAAAVAFVIVALVVVSGVLGFLYWDAARGERALERAETLRSEAVRDASAYAELIGTYTYEDLDRSFSDVVAVSTPEFAEEYENVANELRGAVQESQGVSQGSAIRAAVQSVDENQATVLVFLNQEVTNVLRPDGGMEASRLVVELERHGDRWLLSDVAPM